MSEEKPKKGDLNEGTAPPAVTSQTPAAIFKYDEYWLQRGKADLDATIPGLQARMQGFITYLNTLSGATLIGGISLTTLTDTKDLTVFFLIFVAIAVLQLVKYSIGIEKTAPSFAEIDLRSPIQINKAHNTFVTDLTNNLKDARILVAIATIVYLVCIPWAIYRNNVLADVSGEDPKVFVVNDQLRVAGVFTKDTDLILKLVGKSPVKKMEVKVDSSNIKTDTSKTNLPVKNPIVREIKKTNPTTDSLLINLVAKKGETFEYHIHLDDLEFVVTEADLIAGAHSIKKVRIE